LDDYFLKMLDLVASRSTCARRAVAAIITDATGHVLSTGYNGVPAGMPHCTDVPCPGANRPSGIDLDLCEAIHAEQNALLQCYRLDLARVLYCSVVPCYPCAKLIVNTSILRIVVKEDYASAHWERTLKIFKWKQIFIKMGDLFWSYQENAWVARDAVAGPAL
jgi:dCMP deaminase